MGIGTPSSQSKIAGIEHLLQKSLLTPTEIGGIPNEFKEC
jgi:hypothetical protein